MPDLQQLLATYLNDHLLGATAGVDLFHRAAGSHRGSELGAELQRLAHEVAEDRDTLLAIMADLDVSPSQVRVLAGHVAERLGRLKPNGTLLARSPLTDVVELEGMRVAVLAKSSGWELLRAACTHEPRLDLGRLDGLLQRAADQRDRLAALHVRVGQERLATAAG